LFSTALTISIYTVVDTLLLGFLADTRAIGFYTAAIKINKILIPVIASLGMVLIPRITQSIENKDENSFNRLTDTSFAFICLLGIPLSSGLLVFAPEIMTVFSGPGFADAIPAMQISASLAFIIGLGHLFGLQLLIPGGYQKQYLRATLFGVVTSLVLNILLISSFRERGAAVAIVMGELAVSSASWYYVRRKFSLTFNWMLVLKAILPCLLFIPVAIVLRNLDISPIIRLVIAVGICPCIYFLIQIFVFKEQYIRVLYKRRVER
jgi:O-antigen/teichoic acid export membrane protein